MRRSKVWALICISAILLSNSCSSVFRRAKSEPITAILEAFEKEVIMLEYELTDKQQHRIEGMKFVSGKLNGRRVVIAWTGIGKVNAPAPTLRYQSLSDVSSRPVQSRCGINPLDGWRNPVFLPVWIPAYAGNRATLEIGRKGRLDSSVRWKHQRQIPHLVIRSISDKADEKAREDSMTFHTMAAKNSARLVAEIVGLSGSELSVEKSKKHR